MAADGKFGCAVLGSSTPMTSRGFPCIVVVWSTLYELDTMPLSKEYLTKYNQSQDLITFESFRSRIHQRMRKTAALLMTVKMKRVLNLPILKSRKTKSKIQIFPSTKNSFSLKHSSVKKKTKYSNVTSRLPSNKTQ